MIRDQQKKQKDKMRSEIDSAKAEINTESNGKTSQNHVKRTVSESSHVSSKTAPKSTDQHPNVKVCSHSIRNISTFLHNLIHLINRFCTFIAFEPDNVH